MIVTILKPTVFWNYVGLAVKTALMWTEINPAKEAQQVKRKLELLKVIRRAFYTCAARKYHNSDDFDQEGIWNADDEGEAVHDKQPSKRARLSTTSGSAGRSSTGVESIDSSCNNRAARLDDFDKDEYVHGFLEWIEQQDSKEFGIVWTAVLLATELEAYIHAMRHNMFEPMWVIEKHWLRRWYPNEKYKYAIADACLVLKRHFRSRRRNLVAEGCVGFFVSGKWGSAMSGDECQEHGVQATKGAVPRNLAPKNYEKAMIRASAHGHFTAELRRSLVPELTGKSAQAARGTARTQLRTTIKAVADLFQNSGLFENDPEPPGPLFPSIAAAAATTHLELSPFATEKLLDKKIFGPGAFITRGRIVLDTDELSTKGGRTESLTSGSVLLAVHVPTKRKMPTREPPPEIELDAPGDRKADEKVFSEQQLRYQFFEKLTVTWKDEQPHTFSRDDGADGTTAWVPTIAEGDDKRGNNPIHVLDFYQDGNNVAHVVFCWLFNAQEIEQMNPRGLQRLNPISRRSSKS